MCRHVSTHGAVRRADLLPWHVRFQACRVYHAVFHSARFRQHCHDGPLLPSASWPMTRSMTRRYGRRFSRSYGPEPFLRSDCMRSIFPDQMPSWIKPVVVLRSSFVDSRWPWSRKTAPC